MSAMLDLPAAVAEDHEADDERVCLICLCRPNVTLCGAYQEGLLLDEWDHDQTCPDCERVAGCPSCGCSDAVCCRRCCDGNRRSHWCRSGWWLRVRKRWQWR